MTLIAALEPDARPRERLVARGAEQLTDGELLALVLGAGTRGASALDVAAAVLRGSGGVQEGEVKPWNWAGRRSREGDFSMPPEGAPEASGLVAVTGRGSGQNRCQARLAKWISQLFLKKDSVVYFMKLWRKIWISARAHRRTLLDSRKESV